MKTRLTIDSWKWPPPDILKMSGDSQNPTIKTHFNPAFWLAFWSPDFSNRSSQEKPREKRVHVLSLQGDNVRKDKVGNIHCCKGLGTAILRAEYFKELARKEFPPGLELDRTFRELDEQGDLVLDNENFYRLIEASSAYTDTLQFIKNGVIDTAAQKRNIAAFLVSRRLRHPLTVNSLLTTEEAKGEPRWRVLLEIRKLFGMPEWLSRNVFSLIQSHWTVHIADEDLFPLPDYAVVSDEKLTRIWAALSPRLLLELAAGTSKTLATYRNVAKRDVKTLLGNYRRLSLKYATTEILFSREDILQQWRASAEFRDRQADLNAGNLGPGSIIRGMPWRKDQRLLVS